MEKYDFKTIEPKWQHCWKKMGLFTARDFDKEKEKFYCLTMYPYPSGVLHMGHVINYTLGDVIVRYKILRGYNVLSPMGWDSFGLPAENAARKQAAAAREAGEEPLHPNQFTEDNIAHMKNQMDRAGWGYDWRRELATSRPDYYRWTQWLFLLFYKHGLAEKKVAPVNWCESCGTVLANEQVMGDGTCERCGSPVVQKDLNQWFFKMSSYAQQLLDGHEKLKGKWPSRVLKMQEEWIGRSEGARTVFTVTETGEELPIFTTRPDTLWGVTFMSLAPEHPLIEKLVKGTKQEERVMAAVRGMRAQGTSARQLAELEKVGVWTGFHVTNPVNGEKVPLWVANFALMTYGTGAVMAVPAHDQRDFEFARKYDIPLKAVIQPEGEELDPDKMTEAYVGPGIMVNSGPFTGRVNTEAMKDIIAWLSTEGIGEGTVNYKLRDWLLSRQRYWGAPIPIIYCDNCGEVPVPESDLPVLLPLDVDFENPGNPLETSRPFINCVCPRCGRPARRETDTMDTFVDSSWYFLRYCSPGAEDVSFLPELVRYWMPIDLYIGGIEHATMHLIYFRFFTRVLHDLGYLDFDEPARRLFCQGMVCKTAYYCERCKWIPEEKVEGGHHEGDAIVGGTCATCGGPVRPEMTKISKSKLNIVDPDRMIDRYGADCVRLYMLSDTPPDQDRAWSDERMQGAWRFLNRLWETVATTAATLADSNHLPIPPDLDEAGRSLRRQTHTSIRKVTDAIEGGFRFNTAISSVMELLNLVRSPGKVHPAVLREAVESILVLIAPIVPHFSEELWSMLGHRESIFRALWPVVEPAALQVEKVKVAVQVNGKVRSRLTVSAGAEEEEIKEAALSDEKVRKYLGGSEVVKIIVVPGRLVNIVTK
ncbi:MAG: leucine--tRNA ligase [Candidatus Euphemobacter frigidus]|nr:leucine--tRNA ligase [Candidatus Euphemobacter frigidus]MDP8276111.1 leucine--tRNA ligase [Candidatus Euphemobacter frigidus]